jgi:hypothetical protein
LAILAVGWEPIACVNVSAPGAAMAGFQVSITGRFWVSTEADHRHDVWAVPVLHTVGIVDTVVMGPSTGSKETSFARPPTATRPTFRASRPGTSASVVRCRRACRPLSGAWGMTSPHLARAWAHAVVRTAGRKTDAKSQWIKTPVARRGVPRAIVAVANKNARIIWALAR